MLKCFVAPESIDSFDRAPFTLKHTLLDHPTMQLPTLARVIPEMDQELVTYSKGLSDLTTNFDRAHIEHKNGLSLEQTIETLRTSSAYIAVRNPETHPAFRELFQDMVDDIGQMLRSRGDALSVIDPMLWMFIASPNAITPFHFDRYSNFLLQFRGSKEIAVFNPWNDEVIAPADCESYVAHSERRMLWRPEIDHYAHKFHFTPGDALHIPFVGGHYVRNGAEDVSISLSIFFHTPATIRHSRAMTINHRLRSFGVTPRPVGNSPQLDKLKANACRVIEASSVMLRRLRSQAAL